MIKYKIVDVTNQKNLKTYRESMIYLNQLKKIKVNQDHNEYYSHADKILKLRRYIKSFNHTYECRFIISRKYKHLYPNGFFRLTEERPSFSFIYKLIHSFQNDLRLKRSQLHTISNYDKHTSKMLIYIVNHSALDIPNRVGLSHLEQGTFLKLMERSKIRAFFEYKQPKTNENHIGVELEGIMNISRKDFASKLLKIYPELRDRVTLKDDGSIKDYNEDEYPVEICILDTEDKIEDTVNKVLNLAKENDFHVNKTCGMHVHLDMRNRDKVQSFNNLYKFQNFLYKLTAKDRKKNKFCKPLKIRNPEEFINYKYYRYQRNIENTRYRGINANALDDHKTLEIRIHAGCDDQERINSWIKLLVKIVDAKDIPTKISTSVRKINQVLTLDENLLKYVKKYSKIEKDNTKKSVSLTVNRIRHFYNGNATFSTPNINTFTNEVLQEITDSEDVPF